VGRKLTTPGRIIKGATKKKGENGSLFSFKKRVVGVKPDETRNVIGPGTSHDHTKSFHFRRTSRLRKNKAWGREMGPKGKGVWGKILC